MRQKQRFDLVNAINNVAPKNLEFHLNCQEPDGIKKCSFLGPNTNLEARLQNYDPETGAYDSVITPPVNELDRLAMIHDIAYTSKDLSVRHKADRELMIGARALVDDPMTDAHTRRNARIVEFIMAGKLKLGMGMDVNALVREAQQLSKTPGFQGSNTTGRVIGTLAPLLMIAASIGIPALVKKLSEKK